MFSAILIVYPFDGNNVSMRNCRQTLYERPSHRRISKHIKRFKIFECINTQTICGMKISRPACIRSTVEASKVRKNRKLFAFKKFILPHRLDSATPPRPNERKISGIYSPKKENKSLRIDISVVTPAPWPFMSRTWMAHTRRKPVISTFVYGLDIID